MLQLRDYQQECVDTVNSLPPGSREVVCLATGLGKTVVASAFDFQGRVLWISHRDELVRQPEKYFVGLGKTFGIEKANEESHGEDVVSASIQSISRDNRLQKFDPEEFDFVICDEAHHAAAPTYKKVLSYFKPRILIGLTATPKRGDGVRLDDVFNGICFVRDLRWGIDHGYLSRIRCLEVCADYSLRKVKKTAGDYVLGSLERTMSGSDNASVTAKAYIDYCRSEGRKTLIYCPTVNVCATVLGQIHKLLPKEERDSVRVLTDSVSAIERREILDGFRSGDVQCIVNCMILTEGTDLPDASAIINDRPTCNNTLYQQIVGRGTRLAENKEYCLIIDVVPSDGVRTRRDLCTAPTLFGIDPDALPESVKPMLESQDLLDFVKAIEFQPQTDPKNTRIKAVLIDIFKQEQIALVNNNKDGGYAQIAEAYEQKLIEDRPAEMDFGDLFVRKTPDASRRYEVYATFTGKIWMSEPDMFGKSDIEFDVPEITLPEIGQAKLRLQNIDAKEGIKLIYGFLSAFARKYALVWSLREKNSRADVEATVKQEWRAKKEMEQLGVQITDQKLSALHAGALIDLAMNIRRNKEKHDAAEMSAKRLEKLDEEGLKREQDRLAANAQRLAINGIRILPFLERFKKDPVDEFYADADVEAFLDNVGRRMEHDTVIRYDYFYPEADASAKQIRFIDSLVRDMNSHRMVIDMTVEEMAGVLNMWSAGCVIDTLLEVKSFDIPPNGFQIAFKMREALASIANVTLDTEPEKRPGIFAVPYTCVPGEVQPEA